MFPFFLLGLALLAGFILFGNWFAQADPKTLVRLLKWALITLIVVVIVFFVVTGRAALALAAIPALIPWFLRVRRAARTAKAFHRMAQGAKQGFGQGAAQGGANANQTSEIRTRFLRMSLSHETGVMWGEVLEGPFAGKSLSDLSFAELSALLVTCQQQDNQSAQVLMTWLDREYPDWRASTEDQGAHGSESSGSDGMTRQEALKILGLEDGADDETIREAHHRLIALLHPDKGGSTYLAAKINQAKDFLIGS